MISLEKVEKLETKIDELVKKKRELEQTETKLTRKEKEEISKLYKEMEKTYKELSEEVGFDVKQPIKASSLIRIVRKIIKNDEREKWINKKKD